MKLDFAFLADSATVANGKLFVMGGAFDKVWAKEAPIIQPFMTLVARFELSQTELDRLHKLEVVVLDADGGKVFDIAGEMNISRIPQAQETWRPQGHIVTLNLVNTKFERFGDYAIEILFDGVSVKTLPLTIAPAEQPVNA